MRITKKILMIKLSVLCKELGKSVGFEEGDWNLDYSQCYGGYIVVEFQEGRGERHPLLNKRLTADRMADCLDGAWAAACVSAAREVAQ